MYFVFDSPHKKPYAELRRELEELLSREDAWGPLDVARYCMLQDAMQARRRKFRDSFHVIDGEKDKK